MTGALTPAELEAIRLYGESQKARRRLDTLRQLEPDRQERVNAAAAYQTVAALVETTRAQGQLIAQLELAISGLRVELEDQQDRLRAVNGRLTEIEIGRPGRNG